MSKLTKAIGEFMGGKQQSSGMLMNDYDRGYRDGQSALATKLIMSLMSAIIVYSLTDKKFTRSFTKILRKMSSKKEAAKKC
jgi:hypothetical protein